MQHIRRELPHDYSTDNIYKLNCSSLLQDNKIYKFDAIDFIQEVSRYNFVIIPELMLDNRLSKSYLGPLPTPHPRMRNGISYLHPSFIMWRGEESYFSCLGSATIEELPKDVIKSTGGYPSIGFSQATRNRPGVSSQWEPISLSPMAGGNKWYR